jgi:hypothetical protein
MAELLLDRALARSNSPLALELNRIISAGFPKEDGCSFFTEVHSFQWHL